jgi:hypothetical protein
MNWGGWQWRQAPEVLWRNGTFISVRKIRQHVAAFRRYLHDSADTPEGQELVAAKMMGRMAQVAPPWRLPPTTIDPNIVQDPLRRNAFRYREDGSRRPQDAGWKAISAASIRETRSTALSRTRARTVSCAGVRLMVPALAGGLLEEDGEDRGIVLAIVNADPARQFEFVQSQWVNDGDFVGEGSRSDPIVGRRDRADDYSYPARPVRKHLKTMPDFTVVRGGEHLFLPSLSALRWMTELTGGVGAAGEK